MSSIARIAMHELSCASIRADLELAGSGDAARGLSLLHTELTTPFRTHSLPHPALSNFAFGRLRVAENSRKTSFHGSSVHRARPRIRAILPLVLLPLATTLHHLHERLQHHTDRLS